jgi:hypothetical protein
MINSSGVERRRATNDAVDSVSLFKKKFSQIRTVLASYT